MRALAGPGLAVVLRAFRAYQPVAVGVKVPLADAVPLALLGLPAQVELR
jgi:hypothetical protein